METSWIPTSIDVSSMRCQDVIHEMCGFCWRYTDTVLCVCEFVFLSKEYLALICWKHRGTTSKNSGCQTCKISQILDVVCMILSPQVMKLSSSFGVQSFQHSGEILLAGILITLKPPSTGRGESPKSALTVYTVITLPKSNIAPEYILNTYHPKRTVVFQPSFCWGYVKLQGSTCVCCLHFLLASLTMAPRYGRGAYLAEHCTKADEYAVDETLGITDENIYWKVGLVGWKWCLGWWHDKKKRWVVRQLYVQILLQ